MNSKELIKYLKNSISEKGNYCYSLPIETTKATIKHIKEKDKEIERLKDDNKYLNKVNIELSSEKNRLNSIIKEVREFIEENQEEHKYTDRGGFTYTEGHFLRDSDTLLEILDKVE